MSVEADCPLCPDSESAKASFAVVKVAEHIKKQARHDAEHRVWIEQHTENGTLSEIRIVLQRHDKSAE